MSRKTRYSNWRDDLREVVDVDPKTDTDNEKEITEKKVKNKIVINPTMKEAFEEIGGTVLEVVELDEVLDMKKADMGEVIKDFRKSDAPQFKGKSKEKRREMAIAAKLSAEDEMEEGHCMSKTSKKTMKKEANMDGAPSIKDAKPATKTNVKYYPGLGIAPTIRGVKEETEDSLRDKRMERGGVDGNVRYDKAPKPQFTKGPKKKYDGMSALDIVKSDIRSKYGKGAILDTKKKK